MYNYYYGSYANKGYGRGYGRGDDADNDGYDDEAPPTVLPPHTRPSDTMSIADAARDLLDLMAMFL